MIYLSVLLPENKKQIVLALKKFFQPYLVMKTKIETIVKLFVIIPSKKRTYSCVQAKDKYSRICQSRYTQNILSLPERQNTRKMFLTTFNVLSSAATYEPRKKKIKSEAHSRKGVNKKTKFCTLVPIRNNGKNKFAMPICRVNS